MTHRWFHQIFLGLACISAQEVGIFCSTDAQDIAEFDWNYNTQDKLQFKDGEIAEGIFIEIPKMKTLWGSSLDIKPRKISCIHFVEDYGSVYAQCFLKTGEKFTGLVDTQQLFCFKKKLPKAGFYSSPRYEETYVTVSSLKSIVTSVKSKNNRKLSAMQHTVFLKNGDVFQVELQGYDIQVADYNKTFTLRSKCIQEVKSHSGFINGWFYSESVPTYFSQISLKDPTLPVKVIATGEITKLSWHDIDQVVSGEGVSLKEMKKQINAHPIPDGMVYVPGGKFVFGEQEVPADLPSLLYKKPLSNLSIQQSLDFAEISAEQNSFTPLLHVIECTPFYIDQYEVSNEQYNLFITSTGYKAPSHWENGVLPKQIAKYPVVNISYDDAKAYAKWAGKRLPTEYEWERAAKWDHGYRYPYGEEFDPDKSNVGKKSIAQMGGKYLREEQPFLPQDLSGNVAEWTKSNYVEFHQKIDLDQVDTPTKSFKVVRGGSFLSSPATSTSAHRSYLYRNDFNAYTGFRCVKDIQNSEK